ncbi:MAG: pyridine nucleotide-disulfide oxidoreductase [Chloroflexi bacterium]|nr:MAG: pyridine nucleotide-disulfide oxidoreductase [Chloroflexota bacterium]RLC77516.1 MAG: pyridine nucleotide-disulfide oxidoreductase [Chloroflexota bacterium]
MKHKKYPIVVVGGSAAGLTAGITARRHYPGKDILLVREEKQVLIPCGIPYIFGTVGSPDKDLIPDAVLEKNGIELLLAKATDIDRENKVLHTTGGDVGYERLIIATGSRPAMPPIPGFDLDGVYTVVKDVAYLSDLQQRLETSKDVVIIGGGFIGIEFADEINKAGDKNVTIIEMLPHCLALAYDEEFCVEMEKVLESRGVNIRTSSRVDKVAGDGKVEKVVLSGGDEIKADVVIVGIGAVANVDLAQKAGLRIGLTGNIAVDRTMQTSDENIYACGDCAEKISFFGGRPSPLKLASIATLEARIAGANLFGIRRENVGTVGVWSTAVENTALATAGLTEGMAKKRGYDVVAVTIQGPNRHPGLMPGAVDTRVKLVFERNSGVILGGQVLSGQAAGEVSNIISACVQSRMTAEDIAMFQTGTHPALTASPIAYHMVNAAEMAIKQMRERGG